MKGTHKLCDSGSCFHIHKKADSLMTPLILNWVLMTVIAKCLDKLCYDLGLNVLCFVVIFSFHVLPNWSGIKLCVTQCIF